MVSVTLPPPGVALAVDIAEIRPDALQDTVAALDDSDRPRLPRAVHASTAAEMRSQRRGELRRRPVPLPVMPTGPCDAELMQNPAFQELHCRWTNARSSPGDSTRGERR